MSDIYLSCKRSLVNDHHAASERCFKVFGRGQNDNNFKISGAHAYLGLHQLTPVSSRKSTNPKKPFAHSHGLWCAVDGQIDNTNSFVGEDEIDSFEGVAEIVLQLFRRSDCNRFRDLEGPFALAVVDSNRSRVVLYRDQLGEKPLYYHCNNHHVIAASQERAIISHPDVPAKPDEAVIASIFAVGSIPPIGHTAFESVKELLPGECLIWEKGVWEKERWSLRLGENLLKYRRDEDYAFHYREILERMVKRKLPDTGQVGVMLSSGLDSAPAAAVAAKVVHSQGQELKAYAWELPGFRVADESVQIREVADFIGIPLILTDGTDQWPLAQPEQWPMSLNAPISNVTQLLKDGVWLAAQKDGCTVLLNGWFGDRLYVYGRQWLSEGLSAGAYGYTIGELIWKFRSGGLKRIGRQLEKYREKILNRDSNCVSYPGLTPYARQLLTAPARASEVENHRRSHQYSGLLGPRAYLWGGLQKDLVDRFSLELVDLYRDREMIDFMLSVPAIQFARRGEQKYLTRNAVKGLVPDSIRQQKRVGLLTEFLKDGIWNKSLDWIQGRLFEGCVEWPRFIERSWLEERFRREENSDIETLVVWQCVAYELWLEKLACMNE